MPEKTLEDLAKQVVDSQMGLSSTDDLKAFFEDTPQAPVQPNKAAVEPAPAPAPQASTVTPTEPSVPVEPVVSEPNILEFVPEKFKDADAKSSVEKMARSYAELEAELRREREEKTNLDRMLKTFTDTQATSEPYSMPNPVAQEPTDEGDVEDSSFFDAPTESSKKVARKEARDIAGQMLVSYHNALTEASRRVQYVEAFKASHPDFAEYKEDVAMILKARPDLDKKVESLPFVFELAKQRYRARLEKMRKELGVSTPAVPNTAPTSTPAPEQVADKAALVKEVTAAIIAEINRRKAASGITGGVSPTSPTDRIRQAVTEKPLTEEDRIFQEMANSGPKKLELIL